MPDIAMPVIGRYLAGIGGAFAVGLVAALLILPIARRLPRARETARSATMS